MPLLDAEDLADFIASSCSCASKIVEIGVGFQFDTALALKRRLPETLIVVVDRNPKAVEEAGRIGLKAYLDDVWKPNLEIYEGAALIYAIRPPPELVKQICRIAEIVGCRLLIRPLSGEYFNISDEARWLRITHGKARFYMYSKTCC